MLLRPPTSTLFPYTTLFRSQSTTSSIASCSCSKSREPTIFRSTSARAKASPFSISRHCSRVFLARRSNRASRRRSEEHTSELQSLRHLVCRLLLEKKKYTTYHLLEGFPFIQEPPSGDLQERVLIRHHDYDQFFQSLKMLQWNSQFKFDVNVYRHQH